MGSHRAPLDGRGRRKLRIRKKVSGSSERPRLSVFRTAGHIYAQVIDDTVGRTLACASTLDTEVEGHGGNIQAARVVGLEVARRAKEAGVELVVFDRNGFQYHGRVKALADAAREGGLNF